MRIIAIDWSGAKRGDRRKIWAAEFCNGLAVPELVRGKDRAEISHYLVDAVRMTPELIVGLDFAFSFPSWFVATRCSSVQQLWAKADEEGETWLAECRPPFWGRTNVPRCDLGGKSHYRRTEREQSIGGIQAKSAFQINGAGAVGTGSIRGMAMLHRLKAHFSIWPFDTPAWPRMIEIWPRALTGKIKKSDKAEREKYLAIKYPNIPLDWRSAAQESEDAFDAVVSACVMQKHEDALSSLEATDDPEIKLEGQIWYPPV